MKNDQWLSTKRYVAITNITTGGPGGTTVYTETPVGSIDSVNVSFTASNTITTVYSMILNGLFVHPSEYSVSGNTITFFTAPDSSLSGLPFTIVYA
jgi:hypothetical protein